MQKKRSQGYQTSIYLKEDIHKKYWALRRCGFTPTKIFTYAVEELYIKYVEKGMEKHIQELQEELDDLKMLRDELQIDQKNTDDDGD